MAKGSGQAPPVPERVRHIRDDMVAGKWNGARAAHYEKVWGLSPAAVRTASAEAGRWLAGALGDPEELRGRLHCFLMEAIEMARNDPTPAAGARAVVAAVDAIAKLANLYAPTKYALTDTRGNDLPAEVLELLKRPAAASYVALPEPVVPSEPNLARSARGRSALAPGGRRRFAAPVSLDLEPLERGPVRTRGRQG